MNMVRLLENTKLRMIARPTGDAQWVTGKEILDVLSDEFGTAVIDYIYLDRVYRLVDDTWFRTFIENYSFVDEFIYESDVFDCDDFTLALRGEISKLKLGLAVGLIIVETSTGRHMLNFFVTEKMEVFLVEPQTDELFTIMAKDYTPLRYML